MRTVGIALMLLVALDASAQEPRVATAANPRFVARAGGVDLDGDRKADSLELFCATDEYCDGDRYFDLARFELSRSGVRELRSDVGWAQFAPASTSKGAAADPTLFPRPNLLHSRFVYAHRFGPAGTLLFLFGQPKGGSSGPGVTVYAIGEGGVSTYFEPYEFYLVRFIAPESGGKPWRMLAALSTPEPFSDASFADADLETYCPTTVFLLGKVISIDDAATERSARHQFGAYAGPRPREDVVLVRPHDGTKPFLLFWPSKQRVK